MRLFILLLLLFCACREKPVKQDLLAKAKRSQQKLAVLDSSQNITHIILDIEENAGFEVSEIRQKLDTILSDCTINKALTPNKQLSDIHYYLKQNTVKSYTTYSNVFSQCLAYQFFDCDMLSLLYLAIAEANNLPLFGMLTHEHFFLHYKTEKTSVYWESLTGKPVLLADYAEKYAISKENIGKGNILKPLSKADLIALAYLNIAQFYFQKKEYDKTIKNTYSAMNYSPEWCAPYTVLGQVFETQERYNDAELAYLEAINLQKSNQPTINLLKQLYLKIGCNYLANSDY